MAEHDSNFEGDALLFDSGKDNVSKKNSKNSKKEEVKVYSTEKKTVKNKVHRGNSKKMGNDDIVIRIKKPGKFFLERMVYLIIIVILLVLVLKGTSCTWTPDLSVATDVDIKTNEQIEVGNDTSNTTAVSNETVEAVTNITAQVVDTNETEEESTPLVCDEEDLDVSISKVYSDDNKLVKISVKVTAGDEDLKGYGIYLGAKVPDTTNYIKILPRGDSKGILYFETGKLDRCTSKVLAFTSFSPKYYSVEDDTSFRAQLHDSDGTKLEYATKSHDFS